MSRQFATIIALLLILSAAAANGGAQTPTATTQSASAAEAQLPIPAAAQASDHFDAVAATNAYLATVPPDKRARSDAYFEGGYWLILWNFLYSAAVYLLLLATGWSARMRDLAERITRFKPLRTALYWVQFLVVTAVVRFPLRVYEGFVREHQYGLATQTFGPWLGDRLKGLAVGLVLGGLFVIAIYGVLRRAPRTWWIWGSVVTVVFLMFTALIAPVYIAPLFNKYTKLADPRVKDPILSMARANGIPASEVYVVDASRQSTRVSANVSGFLGTERITLNDNLLNRATLPEIEAVMGHEMGHYVLNHVYKGVLLFGVLTVLGFALLRWGFSRVLARWGGAWRVRGVDDVAGLPLLALLIAVYFFVLTPVTNTSIRTQEYEADIFGLNAAGQPDGEAAIALKLAEYRKLDPGPVEEFVFFDHPSGRTRIHAGMRWKAEHLKSEPAWVAQLGYRADEVFAARRGRLGMPFVEVTIGESARRLVFDTGDMVGLTLATNVLDQLGLQEVGRWDSVDSDGRVIGSYRRVRAPTVKLLGRTLSDQTIFEFSDADLVGLVGPDALPGTRFTLDYRSEMLAVTSSSLRGVPPGFIALPLMHSSRHPRLILARGRVNGHPVLMEFDTGASRTNIDPQLVRELGLAPAGDGVRVDSIAIGPLVFAVPSAKVISKSGIDPALTPPIQLTVGSDILAQIILTVDYASGQLVVLDARRP